MDEAQFSRALLSDESVFFFGPLFGRRVRASSDVKREEFSSSSSSSSGKKATVF